ncbi:MAG TPA: hypothetical protein VNR42_01970 [Solirubrobacteraceae bacterium]|nr:hypothetical protein [Solirubrobacteraceae bacterium]
MYRPLALICAALCASALTACASTVSTTGFSGAKRNVAQTVANLQSDATAGEQKKICANDLAAATVARLGGVKGCESAVKSQLAEVDSLEATVQSIQLAKGEAAATAQVKSIHQGKSRLSSLSLVKEGGKWKISGVG